MKSLRNASFTLLRAGTVAAGVLTASVTFAEVKIGVTLSMTGPAASVGIPARNTIALLPQNISGQKIIYIVRDDASDTTQAVQNTRKFIDENHVDAIIGSSLSTNSLAMVDVVAAGKTPTISLASVATIVAPVDAKRAWSFKPTQNDSLMVDAIAAHMEVHGMKAIGFIGFSDAFGDSYLRELTSAAQSHHLSMVDVERYARSDTSVTGQILRLLAKRPDAVLIAGSGTPGALPEIALKERGFTGKIYQTHGVANNDFLRVCAKMCEGTYLPVGPVLVADQLPKSSPVRESAEAYKNAYEQVYGVGTVAGFGAAAWDAGRMLQAAIPVALKKASPGTPEFREALRSALEHLTDLPISHGILNTTPTDHNGLDKRARVMVQIVDGKWKLQND